MTHRVLVTGAGGYLGSQIVFDLVGKGYEVYAFGRSFPQEYSKKIPGIQKILEGDIRQESCWKSFEEFQPEIIIHLISLDHHKSEIAASHLSSINVQPTWNLLDFYTKRSLKKFIYLSTVQVYGSHMTLDIKEDQEPKPLNNYGLTHYLSEKIVNFYNQNTATECINIRLANGYGKPLFSESNCWDLVVNELCDKASQGKSLEIRSDGSGNRNFIHIRDVSEALAFIVEKNQPACKELVYHLCSETNISIAELAVLIQTEFQKVSGEKIDLFIGGELFTGNTSHLPKKIIRSYNNNKLSRLGFFPKISLIEGVRDFFVPSL